MDFEDITQKNNVPLFYIASISKAGKLILNDTQIKRSVNGIQFKQLMHAEIQGFVFNNENLLQKSSNALSFTSVLNVTILDVEIKFVFGAAGILIKKLDNALIGTFNLSNSSISNCGSSSTATGGLV